MVRPGMESRQSCCRTQHNRESSFPRPRRKKTERRGTNCMEESSTGGGGCHFCIITNLFSQHDDFRFNQVDKCLGRPSARGYSLGISTSLCGDFSQIDCTSRSCRCRGMLESNPGCQGTE